ncbi:CYTH and CHAD domain-containing protein [Streptomyces rochei]|uniref:CYTH and CHAD domain-containing protein n=1 Tax=Streptomyces TaxID=1883 RepID=UPI000A3C89B2|nr:MULTISPECIES: CYTH and CHAD domain-containing protein [Streptomyces]RSS94144.1 CYTH and CHAD domain-containing protein [Streptomyces sp. WAC02707]WDI22540.1 CYTH and CHAD domain-containing protein [Streptomyces enissocaesilis]WMI55734.1 CYTH and CHAD domain-containing protein [Streptomyces rochei]
MTVSKRETERKYEPSSSGIEGLPDLTGAGPVASVTAAGPEELDAVYHDTADLRLAGSSATLRRRTGGPDAGWHLKLPLTGDTREEVRAPLSDEVPDALRELLLSRTRGAALRPVTRVRSTRAVRHLWDADGAPLAEVSLDEVRADSLLPGGGRAEWREVEVELADGVGAGLLDTLEKKLRKKGIVRSDSPSKFVRALRETGAAAEGARTRAATAPGSPGSYVLAYLEEQVAALVALDPAARRELPDGVHRMRVACRRLRSCLRSYRSVLDRRVTDPVRAELKWLAGELGVERDQEVLRERLGAGIDDLPGELVLGPVAARLRAWEVSRGEDSRTRTRAALASDRYLRLLDALDGLLAEPPLRGKATGKPARTMGGAVLKEYDRLAGRMERALALPPGPDRDVALHQARKAAKKVRYAAEVARPVLGKPVKRLGKRAKAVQRLLGDHQDAVVAQEALRELAVAAHAAGETAFTWGVLHGQERARARAREEELPAVWREASDPALRTHLAH